MVNIAVKKNIVTIIKDQNPEYENFVRSFLYKFEEMTQLDYLGSKGRKGKKLKTVRELRKLYVETQHSIHFARGLLSLIPTNEYKISYQVPEEYKSPNVSLEEIKNTLKTFPLRDDQCVAVRKCLYARRGVIQMPTATGKSAIITSVIKILQQANPGLKALVIAPTLSTIENIEDSFKKNDMEFSNFGHPITRVCSNITTALVPSLIKFSQKNKDRNFLKGIGLIIYDECHHLKCDTWNELNSLLPNVEYAFGFSALSIDPVEVTVPDIRSVSYTTALIVGSAGKILMHMDPSYYIQNHIIAQPIVFRLHNEIKLPDGFDETDYPKLVKQGIMQEERTDLIADTVKVFQQQGRKVLILVSEKDHAFLLAKALVKKEIYSYGMSFGAGVGYLYEITQQAFDEDGNPDIVVEHKKEKSLEVLEKLKTGEIDVLIGTSHLDEGVDIANLDVTILAGGGKKDRRIIQRLGRVLRKSKTGKYAYLIDFTDEGSHVLMRHSHERRQLYLETINISQELVFDSVSLEEMQIKFKEFEEIT